MEEELIKITRRGQKMERILEGTPVFGKLIIENGKNIIVVCDDHECNCNCHQPGGIAHVYHAVACCNPCSYCGKRIPRGNWRHSRRFVEESGEKYKNRGDFDPILAKFCL